MRSSKKRPVRIPSDEEVDRLILAFGSAEGEIRAGRTPFGASVAIVLLASMLVLLGLAATVFDVDRVVGPLPGLIVATQPMIELHPPEPAILKSIAVREGQHVKRGAVMGELGAANVVVDRVGVLARYHSAAAQIARLKAEAAGQPLAFPPTDDAVALRYQGLQRDLYDQRRQEYDRQLAVFDRQIDAARAAVARLSDPAATLVAAPAGSGSASSLDEARQRVAALTASRDLFVAQWRAGVAQDLSNLQLGFDLLADQKAALDRTGAPVPFEAPIDGVVLRVEPVATGALLRPDMTLITLMPEAPPLEVEIQIPTRDIGFVKVGDPVNLKIDAFSYAEHGSLKGTIRWISESALHIDGKPTAAFGDTAYKARVSMQLGGLINMPQAYKLLPGMTLQADIHVGTHSLMRYMLKGFVRSTSEALREPE